MHIPSTYIVQSPQLGQLNDSRVSSLIDKDTKWWNMDLLMELFLKDERKIIQKIPIILTNQPDIQIWKGTAKGQFSVCSAYHMAKEKENSFMAKCSSWVGDSSLWIEIWRLNIQNASKNVMWRACHNL